MAETKTTEAIAAEAKPADAKGAEAKADETKGSATRTIDKASQRAKDILHKGLGALERNNLDLAIEMFTACLDVEPWLIDARKFLRPAEIKAFKLRKTSQLTQLIGSLTGIPDVAKARMHMRKGRLVEAVMIVEKLLRQDPSNMSYVNMFCDIVEAAKCPELSVQTLEYARDFHPENIELLNRLGNMYMSTNRATEARACFEKVVELKPKDVNALRCMKNAMALESMTKDGWKSAGQKESDYRDMLKNAGEASLLEAQAKAVRSEKDTDALIAEAREKAEREPNNLNYLRALANLYASAKNFDEAMATLEKAQQMHGGVDPEIDATLSTIRIQKFDDAIATLEKAGDKTGAEAMHQERNTFYFNNLQERIKKYPNDFELKFGYGVALFDLGMYNDAIQQLQVAQKNPHRRIQSHFFLGLCFEQKQQFDLATEQLLLAASEVPTMDDTKKEIYYQLGVIAETMKDAASARKYFKEIYQADISYKDVAQRIEKVPAG